MPSSLKGPRLSSADITRKLVGATRIGAASRRDQPVGPEYVYTVSLVFDPATAGGLHWHDTVGCTFCCGPTAGSALELRVEDPSDPTGYRCACARVLCRTAVVAAYTYGTRTISDFYYVTSSRLK